MVIIEMEETKIQDLTEYAEKVVKYSKKLLHCLEEMDRFQEKRSRMRYRKDEEDFEDYPRYK